MPERNCQILDGKTISETITDNIATTIKSQNYNPHLAVILVGENPASSLYVNNKRRKADEIGIKCSIISLPQDAPETTVIDCIRQCNADQTIHGIIVQMPLPQHVSTDLVIREIAPEKDVDGFHPINTGLLSTQNNHQSLLAEIDGKKKITLDQKHRASITDNINFAPCTALGILHLVSKALGEKIAGKNALIIGRSNIVGKPTAALLLSQNCTITIAHSRSENLRTICQNADILVAAVGKPKFIPGEWIKLGACVIDVGINRLEIDGKNEVVGDVDYFEARKKAGWITPVPGGVGPMTIAYLMHNTLNAYLYFRRQHNSLPSNIG